MDTCSFMSRLKAVASSSDTQAWSNPSLWWSSRGLISTTSYKRDLFRTAPIPGCSTRQICSTNTKSEFSDKYRDEICILKYYFGHFHEAEFVTLTRRKQLRANVTKLLKGSSLRGKFRPLITITTPSFWHILSTKLLFSRSMFTR